ncbi:hypothetical protein [Aequorivita viscosa]|uniref:Uncharacterized protein n=1 Tax=Aequorivita viscosa TaxID=797419 RepID=A0A1M6JJT5_9FLAO|nr:hypothetical protein [Aequorivita viscosa]SDX11800.1 hypothetical protein SAMN05216556_11774 [Aequorivita viscosa]SHJ46939.1 hypothetical protein SAMN04487908_11774 [Aequorivita viscosa]
MKVNYTESQDSQTPALNLLQKLGWDYITPEKAVQERDGFTRMMGRLQQIDTSYD